MADTCVITTEQAERAGAIEFLAAQLLHEVDRVIRSATLERRLHHDLCFAADMLRAKRPKGFNSAGEPARAGG